MKHRIPPLSTTWKAFPQPGSTGWTKAWLLGALAGGLIQSTPLSAQNAWNNSGSTTNWSNPANWSFWAVPTATDTVWFDNVTPGVANGLVDNIVDAPFTISALQYATASTNGYHTTWINPGMSLKINGTLTDPIYVGTGVPQNSESIYSRFAGPGSLAVTNPTGAINVVQGGANADHYATLDLSGLTNFSASLGQILVGCITNTTTQGLRPMGILRLAETNFIQTAAGVTQPGIMVASYPTSDTNLRGTQQLFLGRHNVLNVDALSVGGHKSTGQILFRSGLTGGYASLRGSAGGNDKVKLMTVGDEWAGTAGYDRGNTSVGNSGTVDTTGNYLDAVIANLYVARSETNNNGVTTGTLTFDQGTITADNLYVGYQPSPAASSGSFNANGTVNANGTATLTVNNDLLLARKVGSSTPTATVNVAPNANLNVQGNILTGGGNSTLNANGKVDLQPAGDTAPGYVSVSTLSGSGLITNATSVTNTVALIPGGSATPGTLTIASNLTMAANATFNVNLSSTPGAGLNDQLSVQGNLNLNSNPVVLVPIGASLSQGTYHLVDFTGTRSGYLSLSNPTRYTLDLSYGANAIDLIVSGGTPGTVKWNGTSSGVWDLTTSNWLNSASSTADRFFPYDSVLINDSGNQTNILWLTSAQYPNVVTVNSSTRDYTLGGSGKLSGAASLVKQGSSMLTVSNANDFNGSIVVSGGTLRAGNNSALGTTNGTTTIASGATLDLYGASLYNPGEWVTIAGTGLNNTGAVINTGAQQLNGLRYLTLSDNAAAGTWSTNRWDLRGPGGSGSFSGALNLNGFTLTKLGPAQMSIVDTMVTNAGSLVVGGGILSLTRSVVDGPGYINVSSNILLFENFSTGYVAKPLSVSGGTVRVTGNAFTLGAPITNVSGLTIDNSIGFTVTNAISGAGALTKIGSSSLVLDGPNSYTGPTTISAGTLVLGTNGTLSSTPSLTVASGGTLDVTSRNGAYALASGQTLLGSGKVLGDVTAGPGTGIAPGTSAGTLTFSNNLTLNNSASVFELAADPFQIGNNVNDLAVVSGNLTLNGVNTIKIVPLATLNNASPYTLFQYNGTLAGGLANLAVTSDSRYNFTVVDPATTPGSIQVNVTGSGSSASLLWKGGASSAPNTWDTKTTANWLNGASADVFYLGDNITFDDTAITTAVSLSGTLQPAAMLMNNLSRNYTFDGPGTLVAGTLTNNGGSVTLANSGGVTFGAAVAINGGSLRVATPAPATFAQNLVINSGSAIFDNPADGTLNVPLADDGLGAGTFEKRGANTLTLAANNSSFNGSILVSGGTLKMGNANALGSVNGATTVASGASLDINGYSLYNPGESITISGTGVGGQGAIVNSGGAQNNAVRSLVLAGNAAIGVWGNRWDVRGPSGAGTFSGLVNLNNNTLTKLGGGQIALVDADITSPGSIEIAGGILSLTRCNVDSFGGSGSINLSSNILVLENYSAGYVNKPIYSSGGTLRCIGNSFSLAAPVTSQSGLTLDSSVILTHQGTISGPGSVTKIGTGTNVLAAMDNNWTGGTVIGAGTLQVGTGGYDGSLPDRPILNNGMLLYNSVANFTNSAQISGSGSVRKLGDGILTITASNSFAGGFNTGDGNPPTSGGTIRLLNSYGLGNGQTPKTATFVRAELQLEGPLNIPTNIAFSTSANSDATGPGAGLVAFRNVSGNNVINGPITLNSGGGNSEFRVDAGQLTLNGDISPNATARVLVLSGVAPGVINGALTNNGANIPALEKRDAGTWTLNAANNFTGTTTLKGGTLALGATASINGTSVIDVQSNATLNVAAVAGGFVLGTNQTLKGNGLISGNVTVYGTVTPGESIGALTFANNLVLAGTNVMEIDRTNTPATADVISAAAITYGGTLVVTNLGDTLQLGDTFRLFSAASRSGSFSALILPALDPSQRWDLSGLTVDGTIKVGPALSTERTPISCVLSGNALDIAWPADHLGWTLQSQTNGLNIGLSSNWYVVPGSTATNRMILNINPANGAVFFRLVYP